MTLLRNLLRDPGTYVLLAAVLFAFAAGRHWG